MSAEAAVIFLMLILIGYLVSKYKNRHIHAWGAWSEVKEKTGYRYDLEGQGYEEPSSILLFYQERYCKTCNKYEQKRVWK